MATSECRPLVAVLGGQSLDVDRDSPQALDLGRGQTSFFLPNFEAPLWMSW